MIRLLLDWGIYQRYFSKPDKPLFITDLSAQEEAARQDLKAEGSELKCVLGSRYMGAYLGSR